MIDHLMTFATEADAKADPVVGAYWIVDAGSQGGGVWRPDICIPGVTVWNPAQDVTTTDANGFPLITHTPIDSNWRIIVALGQQSPALSALPQCHIVADRDAAVAGRPFILQTALSQAQLSALMLEPTFAGSNYPFGAGA
jgi:hypothetical protein